MIGNDLVDFRAASRESHWRRKGYLQKLYRPSEQAMILGAENPDEFIWVLWSMKEAAYKIHSAITGERKFAPIKLAASKITVGANEISGRIESEGQCYFTKTLLRNRYVYSIAAQDPHLLERIYSQLYYRPRGFDYQICKPACVSHHGDYLALAYFYEA